MSSPYAPAAGPRSSPLLPDPGLSLARGLAGVVTAALMVLGVLLLDAGPALAHATLVGGTPTDGSVVTAPPERVVLSFDENVRAPSVVIVDDPQGARVDHGETTVLNNTAAVAMHVASRGRYTVAYRVISADGHPVTGQTTFDYQGAAGQGATAGPTAPASPFGEVTDQSAHGDHSGHEGHPAGHAAESGGTASTGRDRWLVGGVVVALLALLALLVTGRGQPTASDTGDDPDSPTGVRTEDPPRTPRSPP